MRVGFDKGYKGFSIFDVEQFTLDKDEIARICMFDSDIEMSWAHWLTLGENDKRSGYYKCKGRYEIIFGQPGSGKPGQGADPDMCKACRVQVKNGPVGIVARRFAANIMRYLTDARGNPRNPPAADCILWRFGDDKYNRLVDINEQYGDKEHGLRVLDLLVKCSQKQFQRFEIDPLRDCLWRQASANQGPGGAMFAQQFVQTWKDNRQTNVADLLGQNVDDTIMDQLIAAATGVSTSGAMGGQVPLTSPADMQRLLDERPAASPGYSAPVVPVGVPQPMPPAAVPQPMQPIPQQFATPPAPAVPAQASFVGMPQQGPQIVPQPMPAPPVLTQAPVIPIQPPLAQPPVGPSPIAPPPGFANPQQPAAPQPGPAPAMPPVGDFESLLKM